jgi:mono/diheme cytochrome c family protein
MGRTLYVSICGICHDSPQRAAVVPNLQALPRETDAEFWRNWISYGKPGSLMPAFAKSKGGILTEGQVMSLVNYLTLTFTNGTPAHP